MGQDPSIAQTKDLADADRCSELAQFAGIVGEEHVTPDPQACAALAIDGIAPKCVVYPGSEDEVAAVLKRAAERELAVVPCRNSTKLTIGNPPRRYDLALSLKEMNRVWRYEPADLTISVEAGMKFGDFQRFVGRNRLWLPLDPPGGAKASIGGILATNASGPLRLAYGAPRDMALGLRVATTEGRVVKTGGHVVKNVAGYDLTRLLIGSYGTLGVIVEASFKLYPLPLARSTFVLGVGFLGSVGELRRAIQHSPLTPMRLVMLNAEAALLARGERPAGDRREVWIEVGGSDRVIGRYRDELGGMAKQAGATFREEPASTAEPLWAKIADFHSTLPAGASHVTLRAVLPPARTEEFLTRAEAQSGNVAEFAQAGTGVVHLCLLEPPADRLHSVLERLRALAIALGGWLVIEKCPAEIKGKIDVWGAPGDDFGVMRKLKQAWDPKGILSPGRFVGGL